MITTHRENWNPVAQSVMGACETLGSSSSINQGAKRPRGTAITNLNYEELDAKLPWKTGCMHNMETRNLEDRGSRCDLPAWDHESQVDEIPIQTWAQDGR